MRSRREEMEHKTDKEIMSYIITILHNCFKILTMVNSKTETQTTLKLLLVRLPHEEGS